MKIIHCADLHLDSKMESNLTSSQAKTRREELLESYDRMVDFAVANQVAVILIAGDMFDKTHIRKAARNRVLERMYENPQIDFLYLQGNHDMSDFLLGLEDDELPENLKTFTSEEWTSYEYEDVVITGREISGDNNKTMAVNLVLDAAKLNIVMLHGQVVDNAADPGPGTISLSEFTGKNIDYLALGHIHSYRQEKLDDRGVYCYSGCLEGRGFDEQGDKGFVLLDADGDKVVSSFIPFAQRKFVEVEAELSVEDMMPDVLEKVKMVLRTVPSKDLVRVLLTGRVPMDLDIDIPRILRHYDEEHFYLKVYDRTRMEIDYDSYLHDKTLKGEFIRLMQREEITEERKAIITRLGMKALLGEELEE